MHKLDFEDISNQLEIWAGISSSSEIHGLVSGLASVGLAANYQRVESMVCRHLDESECPEQAKAALQEIQKAVLEQLESAEFAFKVLLPDDSEDLHLRVNALSAWCQGFLVGFGTGVKTTDVSFSEEAQEVLRDLVEISNVEQSLAADVEEEDEVAFAELEEYIRTAAMMLYTEFGVDRAADEDGSEQQIYH
jgi:uncharacterized protein